MITTAQWRREILPALDESTAWATKGKLTYRTPVDWVLLGVHGEGSGFQNDEVYVSVLTMPLFIPIDHIVLTHARRVSSGAMTFGLENNDLREAVVTAVAQIPTQTTALAAIAETGTEESAYAALLLHGRDAEALLTKEYGPGDDRDFFEDARDRRREVLAILRASGVDAATRQLRQWRNETVSALGVA